MQVDDHTAPPGWYPDSQDPLMLRYWTGQEWTSETAPNKQAISSRRENVKSAEHQQAQMRPAEKAKARESKIAEARSRKQRLKDERIRRASEVAALDVAQREKAAESTKRQKHRAAEQAARKQEIAHEKARKDLERFRETERAIYSEAVFCGNALRPAALKSLISHCHKGEKPWLVIHSSFAGVLAAFDDRVMIIKTGLVTGLGAGTLGGGRITSFLYSEITGIEYNGQLLSGVLEILTPSYQGTKNQDFWKGLGRSANADSSNPFTLSNTLPLNRSEYNSWVSHINELRKRVSDAKKPTVMVEGGGSKAPSIADELAKLAQLQESGVITADDFNLMKIKLIGGTS